MLTSMVRLALAGAIVAGLASVAAAQDPVKKGEELFTSQKCTMCHSVAGKGNKKFPLDGVGAKLSTDDIKQWITHPTEAAAKANSTKKPPMPAKYGSLSAEDLDALVAYLASLK